MNRRNTTLSLLLMAVGVTAAFYLAGDPPLAVEVTSESLLIGGTTRSYRVVVPHTLAKSCPVVFAFHGIGDSPVSMAAYSQLDRLAADNGFILVYPAGRKAMWATIEVNPDDLDGNPDVQFFDALRDRINSRFETDRARVYAIGMSNGASFAQLLAHARSSEIAAIVAHSGASPRGLLSPSRSFPIMLIVGRDDLAVTPMQSDTDRYETSGHDAEIIIVEGLGHEWSTKHNARIWDFLREHRITR